MLPKNQPVRVRKEYPPVGTALEGHGTVTGFNALGQPIAKPEGATLGHALQEGLEVQIVFPQSTNPEPPLT